MTMDELERSVAKSLAKSSKTQASKPTGAKVEVVEVTDDLATANWDAESALGTAYGILTDVQTFLEFLVELKGKHELPQFMREKAEDLYSDIDEFMDGDEEDTDSGVTDDQPPVQEGL